MDAFGKYQVVELIGQGGFGRVYKGYDPLLKRWVAIKTCALEQEGLLARFMQEAEIAGGLRHPHIVSIYDFGIQDGEPYLVQEYLDGKDLDVIIRAGERLDLETRVGILIQVADGLHFAHSRGIIHRDVKPSNLRISADGQVRILDFGIAKLADAQRQLTRTGFSLGTIGYLSPEQLRGEELDHRADIFAFGVVAYELMTSHRPFEGDSISAIFFRIAHEEPPPLQNLSPPCPSRLAACIHRCLNKDRAARYTDCAELVAELRTVLAELREGEVRSTAGVGASPEGTLAAMMSAVRDRLGLPVATLVSLSVVALLLLLAGFWGFSHRGHAASAELDLALAAIPAESEPTAGPSGVLPDPAADSTAGPTPPQEEPTAPAAAPTRASEPALTPPPPRVPEPGATTTRNVATLRTDRVMLIVREASGSGPADGQSSAHLALVESLLTAQLAERGFSISTSTSHRDARQLAFQAEAAVLVTARVGVEMQGTLPEYGMVSVWSSVDLQAVDVRNGEVLASISERVAGAGLAAPAAASNAVQRAAETAAARLTARLTIAN